MSQILNDNEIKEFNRNGAIYLKGKFDIKWIEKLKVGINKAKISPSPRFTNHTKDEKLPSYLEDFWNEVLKLPYSTKDPESEREFTPG